MLTNTDIGLGIIFRNILLREENDETINIVDSFLYFS